MASTVPRPGSTRRGLATSLLATSWHKVPSAERQACRQRLVGQRLPAQARLPGGTSQSSSMASSNIGDDLGQLWQLATPGPPVADTTTALSGPLCSLAGQTCPTTGGGPWSIRTSIAFDVTNNKVPLPRTTTSSSSTPPSRWAGLARLWSARQSGVDGTTLGRCSRPRSSTTRRTRFCIPGSIASCSSSPTPSPGRRPRASFRRS